MERRRSDARGLGHPLRRASGRRGQSNLHSGAREHGEDGSHEGRLADARTSRHDQERAARRLSHRVSLLRCQLDVRPGLERLDGFGYAVEGTRGGVRDLEETAREPSLCPMHLHGVDRAVVGRPRLRLRDDTSSDLQRPERVRQTGLNRSIVLVECEHPRRKRFELPLRGPNVPGLPTIVDHLQQTGLHSLRRIRCDADRRGDAIRGLEADATNVERESVRFSRYDVHRGISVSPNDTRRETRTGAVRLEKHHDVAQTSLLLPRLRDRDPPFATDAFYIAEPLGLFLEHAKSFESEGRHDALRELGSKPLDKP